MTPNKQREDLAYAVIIARVKRNWSMETLATESSLSTATIARVESCKGPAPERDTIVKLCGTLELDARQFLFPQGE
jgi:transcriptional regulator with XRE-family HTH domain